MTYQQPAGLPFLVIVLL